MDPAAADQDAARAPGIVESLRSTIATLVEILHTRAELITTELEEEMHRVAALLLWGVIAVFFGGLFVLMVSVTIIIAAGEENRLLAAIVMTCVFLVILAVAVVQLNSHLQKRTKLLASSLGELKRDRDALRRSTYDEKRA